jgi:hypothetical protein
VQIGLGQNKSYQIAERADAIAISLSENQENYGLFSPTWQLDIYAHTDIGRIYITTVNTVAAVNGPFPSRLIGYCIAPGARAWSIETTGPAAGVPGGGIYLAELKAHAVKLSPPGLVSGFFRPAGRILFNGPAGYPTSEGTGLGTVPLTGGRTDFFAPIAFTGAFGSNETASTIWIMFFNTTSAPGAGTQPALGLSFNVPAGGSFNWVAPGGSVFFNRGLTWVASSTPDTLTPIAGAVARVVTTATW